MAIDWLTARPVAHRGLHGNGTGHIENSLGAAKAAIAANYAIEVDLQLSKDGEAVVFHDEQLDRLTNESGPVSERNASELSKITLKGSGETIPLLSDLLRTTAGQTPLVLELKSLWDGDTRLAKVVADMLAGYGGPVAAMSFDPDMVSALRKHAPGLPRGIVAERWYGYKDWDFLPRGRKHYLGLLLHVLRTKPHFVAYASFDLPATAPLIARYILGMPLLTWTIRTEKDRARVAKWVDQIIFEHIRP
ncbi:MAG TPA: glycerophosphodiester phosphodiesterase family protein [Xanthobacteraceae bacterium]|nr:glycerophosphodiester phosphodiesterase family protein [Xanthobacteraceae bacterium]